jgi:hypothetical protein
MFASTAMPTVNTTAAIPGKVKAAPNTDNSAVSSTTLAASATSAINPNTL